MEKIRALYFSGHLILVENIYGNQSEAKLMCLTLKLCQNISQGTQSIHFSKGEKQGCGSGSNGSAFIFPPGSGSAFNMRIRIQEGKFVN